MKPTKQAFERLLDAAAKAPAEPASVPPFGLETRVLAQWRAAGMDDDSVPLLTFLRHAMFSAALVLVLSAAWSLTRPGPGSTGDEAAFLDYEIQMSLNP